MKQEKSCGCIITKNNKVLLVKHNKGHWDFPKGHMEKGETEIETALREVKEETNLDVTVQEKMRYTVEYITDKGNEKQVVYFLANKAEGEIKPQESEVSQIEWIDFEKAENRITYETSKELWKKVLKTIKEEFMKEAIKETYKNEVNNYKQGGPFGAIIEKDGKIIARGHNTVIASKDSTAHAEINAIRKASEILGTHDLSGCTLYTSAEPCPMCLSAIIWSNIKEVYFANTKEDAKKIGFRDDMIYEFIKTNNTDKKILNMIHMENTEAIKTFENFKNNNQKVIY